MGGKKERARGDVQHWGQDSTPKPHQTTGRGFWSGGQIMADMKCQARQLIPDVPGNTSGAAAAIHVLQSCTIIALPPQLLSKHTHNERRACRRQSLRAGACEGRQDPPLPVPRRTASQQHVPAYGGRQVSDRRWQGRQQSEAASLPAINHH